MKKFLTLLPAVAVALVLTACSDLPQPQIPETPKSVERALQKAIAEDAEVTTEVETMEAAELSDEDVTIELDAALDGLEADLDAALVSEDEAQTEGENTEVDAEASAQIEETPEAVNEGEEEVIDEPIIIE